MLDEIAGSTNRAKHVMKRWRDELPTLLRLARQRLRPHADELPDQPFDRYLLRKSALYAASRRLALRAGVSMRPGFVSKSRSLSSDSLVQDDILYSPLSDELAWLFQGIRVDDAHAHQFLGVLMNYNVVVFHEQNHRLIRTWFPPHPDIISSRVSRRRYHHFQEAWAGTLDLLLSDELPSYVSSALSAAGILYSHGPPAPRYASRAHFLECTTATLQSAWLRLEGLDVKRARECMERAGSLRAKHQTAGFVRGRVCNDGFDQITNPYWQAAYGLEALRAWSRQERGALRQQDFDGYDSSLPMLAQSVRVVARRLGLKPGHDIC